MPLKNTLESKMSYRIAKSKQRVFLREDFADFGYSYRQVGRILQKFVKSGKLMDMGYGLYARTRVSRLTGAIITDGWLGDLAKEYLTRRGIEFTPTQADLDNRSGKSTQVPTGRGIGIRGRISRRIGFEGAYIFYDKPT